MRSSWWLVVREDDGTVEVLTLDGGDTLPVFSGEQARGWEVHEVSAEDLVSVLSGPYSRVGLVALDPSVEILDGWGARTLGSSREDFVEWVVSRSL
jgi:hypothetical protein